FSPRFIMGRCVLLVLALGIGTSLWAAPDKPPKKDAAKKELKKLQGDWVVVYMERNGEFVPQDDLKPLEATIKDNKFAWRFDPKRAFPFTIDVTKKPKKITYHRDKWGTKEIRCIGIYEFDGDKLKECTTLAGGKRPKEFTSKGGTKE